MSKLDEDQYRRINKILSSIDDSLSVILIINFAMVILNFLLSIDHFFPK